MNDKQVTEANDQLAKARARTEDLKARLARMAAVREAYGEDRPALFDETITEATGNAIINGLRTRYLELVNREADFSAKYGANHSAVVNTRNQIRAIRTSIRDELGRIEQTFRSELQIAQRRQDELEKSLSTIISQSTVTSQAQVALFSLESAAQSYRKLYDNFLQRHTEVVQQQSFPIVEARSLSPASVNKTGPKALQIWLATIFGGAALGIGGGLLREAMDRGFRTREQVRSVLQTDCLALVPRLPPQERRLTTQRAEPMPMIGTRPIDDAEFAAHMARQAARGNSSAPNVMRTVVDTPPSSPYAEAIRSIKLSVDLNSSGSYTKVIGFTSCLPSEGKTTLASAMATIISQSGARVLLVDCDLRNPSLSRMLTPDATVGFLDVVAGKVPLTDAIWADSHGTLAFLPSVVGDRYPYATEMLSSEAAKSLFSSLQIRYDYVILDLAPMVAALDVRAAKHVVDSYVMVVEWGTTKVDAVKYALRSVPGVQEKLVGVVLNKVDMNSMKYYDNYGAAYYYGQSRYPVH
jgi:succinoglycan biosynthesis transport protein ExoP